MPATYKSKAPPRHILGVDGCKAGWLVFRLFAHDGKPVHHDAALFETFKALLMAKDWGATADLIIIDIPIGLVPSGRRDCDRLARCYVGNRRSSIFAAPRRPMITMGSYEEANRWGKAQGAEAGGGLSRQAWGLVPKIKEVDDCLTPALQARVREGHPEVAFARLNNGQGLGHYKKAEEGKEERVNLLEKAGLEGLHQSIEKLLHIYKGKAALDDYLDAAVLSRSALDALNNKHIRLSTDKKDEKGLVMEILG